MDTQNFIDVSSFTKEEAREYLEQLRWANGIVCPHCQSTKTFTLKPKQGSKSSVREGVHKCSKCRKQFTVTVGTIFEDSHIPLNKWLIAVYLIGSSKKGISSNQLSRLLQITYKSAWFMSHRIRYAMEQTNKKKLKGTIEADETYIGGKKRRTRNQTGFENKSPVVALVQRGGNVRSFAVPTTSARVLKRVLNDNVSKKANLITDEWPAYKNVGKDFNSHEVVNHSRYEYVRGDVYTNTIEGYFGILKRGVNGTFHHISRQHLKRYLAEFDFRYNLRKEKDKDIIPLILKGFEGKRLTYRGVNS
jgi:transposase-like protein